MEDWLKCQIGHLVKYRQNLKHKTITNNQYRSLIILWGKEGYIPVTTIIVATVTFRTTSQVTVLYG